MTIFVMYFIVVLFCAYVVVFPNHLVNICGKAYKFCKKYIESRKRKRKGDSLRSVTIVTDGKAETTFYGEDAPMPVSEHVPPPYEYGAACSVMRFSRPVTTCPMPDVPGAPGNVLFSDKVKQGKE